MVSGYEINHKKDKIYQLRGDLPNGYGNTIHPWFTFSDAECEKLDRKLKLQCLNSIQ